MNTLDLDKLPIINAIKNYLDEDIVPFSMPGHKYSKGILNNKLKDILLMGDITEVDGLDNLHNPEGIIKRSEKLLTKTYNSVQSFYLVNGSTSGNMIMIFSAFNEGDKIIVERNCHRSIMNSIIMKKLSPIYVKNIIHKDLKCPISINIEHLTKILEENNDIRGIVLTYPYYHGLGINIETIVKYCKSKGLTVLIDSAHGAHFGFSKNLPKSAQEFGADMVVMSAHKTLPSLTQTAYIHVNNKFFLENVKFYKEVFLSTSPSYMFMMSLEYGRYFLETQGEKAYEKLLRNISEFRKNISKINEIEIIDFNYFNEYEDVNFDESRIVVHLKEGYSGHKMLEYLRRKKIQCEMSDERNVILIPSPFNETNDFVIVEDAIKSCDFSQIKDEEKGFYEGIIPQVVLMPFKVIEKEYEKVPLDGSIGRVVAENIIPYPPGVPILIMGELIESNHIKLIQKCLIDGVTVLGMEERKVKVVKNI